MVVLATLLSLPLSLGRGRIPLLRTGVLAFTVAYLLHSFGSLDPSQALRNTLATASAGSALLVFGNFGSDIVLQKGFRRWATWLSLITVPAVLVAGLPKNIAGGCIIYAVALATMLQLARGHARAHKSRRRTAILVSGFLGLVLALGVTLGFRALVGYAFVLSIGYLLTGYRRKSLVFLLGVAIEVVTVGSVSWYFTHIHTSARAAGISDFIARFSGRTAASGRDILWPAIIDAVKGHEWFGLGSGALPRDLFATDLSAHSFYFQVYLQMGWFGLALLTVLLLIIWRPLAYGSDPVIRFGGAIFLLFLAHNGTEVLMFQNALLVAIPAWCTVGLALSRVTASPSPSPGGSVTGIPHHKMSPAWPGPPRAGQRGGRSHKPLSEGSDG